MRRVTHSTSATSIPRRGPAARPTASSEQASTSSNDGRGDTHYHASPSRLATRVLKAEVRTTRLETANRLTTEHKPRLCCLPVHQSSSPHQIDSSPHPDFLFDTYSL